MCACTFNRVSASSPKSGVYKNDSITIGGGNDFIKTQTLENIILNLNGSANLGFN